MKISFVVAMTPTGMIGKNNQLLWHLPNDLKHFKKLTLGKPVIMGRKTYLSIGKPLPGRQNIVLSRQTMSLPGVDVVSSVEEALMVAQDKNEICVIGGGEIYSLFSSMATHLYITYVHHDFDGDTVFRGLNLNDWEQIHREDFEPDESHPYAYSFVNYIKKGIS